MEWYNGYKITSDSRKKAMAEKSKSHFIGFLANSDSSILDVKLDHGFQIESLHGWDGNPWIRILEPNFDMAIWMESFVRTHCYNTTEQKYFIITNSFEYELDNWDEYNRKLKEFYDQLYHGYIEPTLQLLRLYKKGNICIPVRYECSMQKNKVRSIGKSHNISWHVVSDPYRLESSETSELNSFLTTTKIPFNVLELELARENYDLSYSVLDLNLRFLSLMNGLEALFNDGQGEITYKLSRYTAVLLGTDFSKSEEIFKAIKELYNKRSNLVHQGKAQITENDVQTLQDFVRESIVGMYRTGQTKKKILEKLDTLGFGGKDTLY